MNSRPESEERAERRRRAREKWDRAEEDFQRARRQSLELIERMKKLARGD